MELVRAQLRLFILSTFMTAVKVRLHPFATHFYLSRPPRMDVNQNHHSRLSEASNAGLPVLHSWRFANSLDPNLTCKMGPKSPVISRVILTPFITIDPRAQHVVF